MRPATIVILFASLAIMAAGQLPTQEDSSDKEPITPPHMAQSSGECYRLAMKNLLLATDTEDPSQEAYIRAANAYLQLEQHGQVCT